MSDNNINTNANSNDMAVLTARAERLVSALTDGILATVQVAAERIELAANLAQVHQRMSSFATIIETVGAQKQVLLAKLETAKGAMKSLLKQQLDVLTMQELAVLVKAGISQPAAKQALAVVDGAANGNGDGDIYVRRGRRFEKLEAAHANGVAAIANGVANGNGHSHQQ